MRKTMKRKGADTRSAARHMLRAIRGLTHEISVLRRYVLELRAQGHGYIPYQPYPVPPRNPWDSPFSWGPNTNPNISTSNGFSPTDSIDSPQPK